MISFIVIGKNEGWKLTKCMESIFATISINNLNSYEVIYVDSNSDDDSIKRVLKFKQVKIFKITSKPNAAIARNIGAKEAIGEYLFFIDGDMEIFPEFLPLVYSEDTGLKYNFVSGQFINYYYTKENKLIAKEQYHKNSNDKYFATTGGLFFIKKECWLAVNGMKPVFKKSQDIDLGLRLAKRKIFLLRKKEVLAIHHTINYLDINRMWSDFYKGNHLYASSLLYRSHILNIYMFHRLIRNDYSMIFLFISILGFVYNNSFLIFIPYFILIIARATKLKKQNIIVFFNLLLYYFVKDLTTILGLFLFWPNNKFNINYEIIDNAD